MTAKELQVRTLKTWLTEKFTRTSGKVDHKSLKSRLAEPVVGYFGDLTGVVALGNDFKSFILFVIFNKNNMKTKIVGDRK